MIRVLLADDQAVVRGGLRMILDAQPYIEVVGEAETDAQAIELARETTPDVMLMDIRMPELDGIAAIATARMASCAEWSWLDSVRAAVIRELGSPPEVGEADDKRTAWRETVARIVAPPR